jgi:GT2 family glycosyltransferase
VQYFLQLCLQSVTQAIKGLDAEIIVVDNKSVDGSCQMIRDYFPDVILIPNNENYGFSKGNNIGVEKSRGEYVCILNPDTVVAEDTFKSLLQFAESQDNLGVVGCKLIDGTGKFLPESKRNVPTAMVSLQKMIGDSSSYYANRLKEDEAGEVDILVGAFLFLRRLVFDEVKGFDEDYFMYGEDIDFCYKVLKLGYKNYYYPKTTILHFKGESTLKDKRYAKRFYSAMQIFYKKHFRKNIFVDAIIWIGIKLISIVHSNPKIKQTEIRNYIMVSNELNGSLQLVLKKKIDLFSNDFRLEDGHEIIFDSNKISFKEILNKMENLSYHNKLTYKILPKKTNYIIGSNSSKLKGEVITF